MHKIRSSVVIAPEIISRTVNFICLFLSSIFNFTTRLPHAVNTLMELI